MESAWLPFAKLNFGNLHEAIPDLYGRPSPTHFSGLRSLAFAPFHDWLNRHKLPRAGPVPSPGVPHSGTAVLPQRPD